MKRTSLALALCGAALMAAGITATQAARQPLLMSMKAKANLTADGSYRALAASRTTESLQLVQADASQINAKTDTLQIGLGDAGTAYMQYSKRNPDGTTVWYGNLGKGFGLIDAARYKLTGEIADDPNNSVMIVRNGDKLTGTIRSHGQLYKLRPLASGGHALVRVNESKMPLDDAPGYERLFRDSIARQAAGAARAKATGAAAAALAPATIRIMVVTTKKAASLIGDVPGLINLAIAESNQGYANSGINITLQLAGSYSTTYVETDNYDVDVPRFAGTNDGYMDSIHATRNSISADVGVLLVNDPSYCGQARAIGATASTAFAAVHWDCATGYYSFAHEIGHLQGARHDPANDPTNTPYAYGHGYQSPTKAWRTVMAYNCSPSCPRINYWSNPNKTYGGQVMGTTTRNDNTRVLNATAATVAAFR